MVKWGDLVGISRVDEKSADELDVERRWRKAGNRMRVWMRGT